MWSRQKKNQINYVSSRTFNKIISNVTCSFCFSNSVTTQNGLKMHCHVHGFLKQHSPKNTNRAAHCTINVRINLQLNLHNQPDRPQISHPNEPPPPFLSQLPADALQCRELQGVPGAIKIKASSGPGCASAGDGFSTTCTQLYTLPPSRLSICTADPGVALTEQHPRFVRSPSKGRTQFRSVVGDATKAESTLARP